MASNNDSQPREQWAKQSDAHRTDFERAEKPTKYRIAAWALWILGIACAFGSALVASRAFYIPFLSDLPVLTVVLAVVVDLVAVLAAQRFWRRAAALAPAKKAGSRQRGPGLPGVCPDVPLLSECQERRCQDQGLRNRFGSRVGCRARGVLPAVWQRPGRRGRTAVGRKPSLRCVENRGGRPCRLWRGRPFVYCYPWA